MDSLNLRLCSMPALLWASSNSTSTILREHRCSHSIGSASKGPVLPKLLYQKWRNERPAMYIQLPTKLRKKNAAMYPALCYSSQRKAEWLLLVLSSTVERSCWRRGRKVSLVYSLLIPCILSCGTCTRSILYIHTRNLCNCMKQMSIVRSVKTAIGHEL
jgi:hypothetical protein